MQTRNILIILIIIVILGAAAFIWEADMIRRSSPGNGEAASSTTPMLIFDRTISDGTVTFAVDSAKFGLATTQDQILVHSYIPPCDGRFDYCLYYIGQAYAGTNFESAGLRIDKRSDLGTDMTCLRTQPDGFTGLVPQVASSSDYVVSTFSPMGDAAAGHYASGALYRLWYDTSCYEFETRIGETQFMNYPSGSIKEFTADDRKAMVQMLSSLLSMVSLPSGEKVSFPAPVAAQQ